MAQEVHYSPEEDLARIDAKLISEAKTSIDFASYALTDLVIIQALTEADRRGIAIRIVFDPRERHDFVRLGDLADTVRIKRGLKRQPYRGCALPCRSLADRTSLAANRGYREPLIKR